MKLALKILFLFAGALVFFLLFPLFLARGWAGFSVFCGVLAATGSAYRVVAGKREFRVTLLLWLSGTAVYGLVALVLIVRRVQPHPYVSMSAEALTLYHASYPLRVLGVFFVGLIFVHVTSPVEFLALGGFGLKAALAYRAFEFSVNAFDETRRSMIVQGYWPDPTAKRRGRRDFITMFANSPALIATTFRNIILWFPWAWICYTSLVKDLSGERRGEEIK